MYFKITNATENHHGFQYSNGLNVLREKFNDNPADSCCAGGFYFTNAENIFKYLDYGIYLREVILPTENPDFRMIKDPEGDKWRANMIILGKRYDLYNIDTFEYLFKNGANIHASNDYVLCFSAASGHLDVIKFLIANGANIHVGDDYALRTSAVNGHSDVVKFLVEKGADIHVYNDHPLKCAAHNGHFNSVKILVDNGANIHAGNDYALRYSAENGHLDVVKFLVENGADIHADDDY